MRKNGKKRRRKGRRGKDRGRIWKLTRQREAALLREEEANVVEEEQNRHGVIIEQE